MIVVSFAAVGALLAVAVLAWIAKRCQDCLDALGLGG